MLELGGVAGRRFLVIGLGRSGRAAYRSLEASGAHVRAWDDDESERKAAQADGFALGDPGRDDVLKDLETVVVSPGVPHLYPHPSPAVTSVLKAGVPLDNDIGLFFSRIRNRGGAPGAVPEKVIAVTGSNGKSTTTALINHILNVSGRRSEAAGNIGRAVLELSTGGGFVVLEVSSYQAELARCLDPDISVFLNFSPDHLDRHGGIGGYFSAKTRLFGGPSLAHAVIGIDEVEGRYLAARTEGQAGLSSLSRVGLRDPSLVMRSGTSVLNGRLVEFLRGVEISSLDLERFGNLRGIHNHQNACAAFSACRCIGLTPEQIGSAMETFPGLEHRMQILGTFRGVQCVNDSKATNARSAEMALNAFRRIRWIAGGLAKEGGITSLSSGLENVAKAYLIGSSAREFAEHLGSLEHEICGDLSNAVKRAFAEAAPGDTILLSPAAASFDQYPDFERRGDHFASEVRKAGE